MVDCPLCNMPFPETKIEQHASTCTGEPAPSPRKFQKTSPSARCPICNKELPSEQILQHVETCMADSAEIVVKPVATLTVSTAECPSCGRQFPLDKIFSHVETCKDKPVPKPVVAESIEGCPFCFKNFPSSELAAHMEECEGGERPVEKAMCPVCNAIVLQSQIEEHVAACLDEKPTSAPNTRPLTPPPGPPIEQLRDMLPFLDGVSLSEALATAGNDVERALALLLGGGDEPSAATATAEMPPDLRRLSHIFPDAPESMLRTALERCEGDLSVAVAWLMGDDFSAQHHSSPDDGLPPAETVRTNGVVVRIRRDVPCQSLRNLHADPVAMLTSQLPPSDAQFCAYCFSTMVEREQQHCKDYCVFYHSYSLASLLYELQSEVAAILYGLPTDFPPLPRLLHAPFKGKPTLKLLLAGFASLQGNVRCAQSG
eukprot:TRINITY_DN420_c2_g1_i10.p1 TRINITY_DN420_c2_g1~~TRINITY_DN420_c2_g1_i10.p1  ORF type:complete len:429 (-),score=83.71 TRINITY_DN420_c2_g1_i10:1138-2424(-)